MSTSHCICLPHICSSLAAICVVGLGHSHIQPGQIPRQQLGQGGFGHRDPSAVRTCGRCVDRPELARGSCLFLPRCRARLVVVRTSNIV